MDTMEAIVLASAITGYAFDTNDMVFQSENWQTTTRIDKDLIVM